MIYVVAAAVVALGLLAVASLRTIEHLIRQHARERDLLLNQVLHLSGKTWTPPPAEPAAVLEPPTDPRVIWTATPEQFPN